MTEPAQEAASQAAAQAGTQAVAQTAAQTAAPSAAAPAARCVADYFDGQHAAARRVRLTLVQGQLHIDGLDPADGIALRVAARAVSWPERQRHGVRLAYLPREGMLSCSDSAAWDAWARASGLGESIIVRWMQSWRGVAMAAALLLAVLFGAYRWGTPLAAQALLALCPAAVDEQIGSLAFDAIDKRWLLPSRLSDTEQAQWRARFEQALQRTHQASGTSPAAAAKATQWTLLFRATPEGGLGANALALPGGRIVVTDAMVKLLADRPDVLMGVLGHELGHVQHRHGMRMLVQAALLAALSSAVIGDFSALLTLAPVLLGQLDYGREFEYQADQAAATLMRANGWRPEDFSLLFERLAKQSGAAGAAMPQLPIGLSTHPPDAERVRRMVQGQ